MPYAEFQTLRAKAVHCRSTEDWTREELYDEDLNNGQVVEGVKIVNPFV